MRKSVCMLGLWFLAITFMAGCTNNYMVVTREGLMKEKEDRRAEEKAFLQEKYHLSNEQLDGIDAAKLVDAWELHSRNYSSEDVVYFLEKYRKDYVISAVDELFDVLEIESVGGVPDGSSISAIWARFHTGNNPTKRVFLDVDNCRYCYDDLTPHEMGESHANVLKRIVVDYDVFQWPAKNTGAEPGNSTGSFGWKLVFETESGALYAYEGYTEDGSSLPQNFDMVYDAINSAIK